MRPFVITTCFGFSLLVLAACDDHDAVGGTYVLVSIDGDHVPATILEGEGYRYVVTDGSIQVTGDSLIRLERVRSEATTHSEWYDTDLRSSATYVIEGGVLRGIPIELPQMFPFNNCTTAGVYRIEDDADRLRMIDIAAAGSCEGSEPLDRSERVYLRD